MAKSAKEIRKDTRAAWKCIRDDGAAAEAVHDLRTGLRRFEALSSDPLPKKVKRLRKRAGQVRDLDVLLKLIADLKLESVDAGTARKMVALAEKRRDEEAEALVGAIKKVRLSQWTPWIRKNVRPGKDSIQAIEEDAADAIADSDFENLGQHNLHDFRLKIKPLRYRAEMLKGNDAKRLASQFNTVQTAIGDWHDLVMLRDFAEEALSGGASSLVLERIRAESEHSYQECLRMALRLRRQLLHHRLLAAA